MSRVRRQSRTWGTAVFPKEPEISKTHHHPGGHPSIYSPTYIPHFHVHFSPIVSFVSSLSETYIYVDTVEHRRSCVAAPAAVVLNSSRTPAARSLIRVIRSLLSALRARPLWLPLPPYPTVPVPMVIKICMITRGSPISSVSSASSSIYPSIPPDPPCSPLPSNATTCIGDELPLTR